MHQILEFFYRTVNHWYLKHLYLKYSLISNIIVLAQLHGPWMLPDKAKFTECSIIKLAILSLLMRHLVIGQRQKAPNFSAFHWSPHGCLITIGQHFLTTRVVHLPKRTETSLITESDQSRANHQLLQVCTVRTAWSDSDQAVRAVHSCKSGAPRVYQAQ